MNSDETRTQLDGMICDLDDRCCMGGFIALPARSGAFEPQSNE
jgi:hypothetical protein